MALDSVRDEITAGARVARRDPVDQVLPPGRLLVLGLQHVLVMYAGAVAAPLIIGRALTLAPEPVAQMISADLFAAGLATLIQAFGLPGVGVRLPVMMGVTFASVGPMLAMVAAGAAARAPHALAPLLNSGVLLATIAAVALNLYYNGVGGAPARTPPGPGLD